MFYFGAAMISIGVTILRPACGLITAGAFVVLLPLLEIASGFVRGLRDRST